MEVIVIDKFNDKIRGTLSEYDLGKPQIRASFHGAASWGNTRSPKQVKLILEHFYAGSIDDVEAALIEAEFTVISIDTSNSPQRQITPHKGGRSVKKSTDVTPDVAEMLSELYKDHGISLGDIVDEAVRSKYDLVKAMQ